MKQSPPIHLAKCHIRHPGVGRDPGESMHSHWTPAYAGATMRVVFLIFLMTLSEITHASADPQNQNQLKTSHSSNTTGSYFISSNKPPAGFENMDPNAPQTTMVSVYYGDQLLINTLATFNNQTITFANPAQILNNLQGLKNTNVLNSELAKTQDTHMNLLCQDGSGNYCKELNPKDIGVIFDANNYKAYLFLNPSDIQVTPIQNNLPDSTAGFSALLNNDALLTHNQFNTYALNTEGVLGKGNGYFSSNIYYTHEDLQTAQDSLDITEAAGHFYKNQNFYFDRGLILTILYPHIFIYFLLTHQIGRAHV